MLKENRTYFIVIFVVFVGIWILKPITKTLPNVEQGERVELISFEQMQGLTKNTIKHKGVLYDFTDEILYYPERTNKRYEALVQLEKPDAFNAKQVLFLGSSSDFNLLVKELSFVDFRNNLAVSADNISPISINSEDGLSLDDFVYGLAITRPATTYNVIKGFVDGGSSVIDGVKTLLEQPYESAKKIYTTISKIPSKTWDVIQGEYSYEDVEKLLNAYFYNAMCELAKEKGLNYEETYLQKTKDEISDATKEYLMGTAAFEIVATIVPVTKISKLKHVQKTGDFSSLFKYKNPSIIPEKVIRQTPANFKDFITRVKSKKEEAGGKNSKIDESKKQYSDPKKRPLYKKGLVDEVYEKAKQPDGNVYDPNTGEILKWDKSKSRAGQWDMGHKPGKEYKKLHKDYRENKITKEKFLEEYNSSDNYYPESPSANRSHRYEES